MWRTLIEPQEAASQLGEPDWAFVDTRFSLEDEEQGRRDYTEAHIPGAIYADLNKDLSAPVVPGKTGRHPLPKISDFVENLSHWGIDSTVQVVVYDYGSGAYAARLWWMLRWLGHEAVAVINGGWEAWLQEGLPVQGGEESRSPRQFQPDPRPELVLTRRQVEQVRLDPTYRIYDARSADRYQGENETLDPVAGHIPGAVSSPYEENLEANARFLPRERLQERFKNLLGDIPPERAVFYCGSGVTAAHNVLALMHAGMGEGRLYAGSWSEWITDPNAPVSRS